MPAGPSLRRSSPMRVPAPSLPRPSAGRAAATVAVPKPPADAPPGLYLRALLAPKSEPVGLTAELDGACRGAALRRLSSPAAPANPYVPVPPGRYVVRGARWPRLGQHGRRRRRQGADRGRARPQCRHLAGEGAGAEDRRAARRCHHHHQRGGPGRRQEGCADGRRSPPSRAARAWPLLPPGRYLVRVEQGLVRAERSVVVPAGSQGRHRRSPQCRASAALRGRPRDRRVRRAAHLQHRRGRPRRAERPARGGALGGAAGGLRAAAGHLLRDRAARHASRRARAWPSAPATW